MKQLKYHLTALLAVASFASMASAQLRPHTTVTNNIYVDPYGNSTTTSVETVDNTSILPTAPKQDTYVSIKTGNLRASDLQNRTIVNYYNLPSSYYGLPTPPCPPTPTYNYYPGYNSYPAYNSYPGYNQGYNYTQVYNQGYYQGYNSGPNIVPGYSYYTTTPSYCPPAVPPCPPAGYCPPVPSYGGYGYSSHNTGVTYNNGGLSLSFRRQSTSVNTR